MLSAVLRPVRLVAVLTLLGGCGTNDMYLPKPVPILPPEQIPGSTAVPGTAVETAAYFLASKEQVHEVFGKNGLWREHVLVVRVEFVSHDKIPTDLLLDSANVKIDGTRYRAISPNETYDIAWQSKQPYKAIEATAYGAGELLFTAVTLGVGSVVYALPSPFTQPAPNSDAFGRDINNEALSGNITLVDGSVRAGYLFFAVPQSVDLRTLRDARMDLHFLDKATPPAAHSVTFLLTTAKELQRENKLRAVIDGMLGSI